jgi:exonuclease III
LNLNIISQNCQSLNVSTKNRKTTQKIVALTKTGADIILMSDIRLNSLIQIAATNDIAKKLEFNGYEFYYNSPFASRGVGIAVKKTLGLLKNNQSNDRTGNILAIDFTFPANNAGPDQHSMLTIFSLYGPNDNNGEFYNDLNIMLEGRNNRNIILGGDFNCTWDNNPPEQNIDVINMRSIPSRFRTEKILNIARKHNLVEPFRFLRPNSKDFTYIPNAIANQNRSRIDFFLISNNLLDVLQDSGIKTEKLSSLFDHKSIFLNTGKKKPNIDPNKVCNSIIENKLVQIIVEITVKETYLNNADPEAVPRYTTNLLKAELGRVFSKLKEATNLEFNALNDNNITDNIRLQVDNLIQDASDISETLPSIDFFEDLPLSVNPDIFFEGLVLSVKNEILSKQAHIYKLKNFRKKLLRENIWGLKKNYDRNWEEIHRQEKILNDIVEEDLKKELSNYELFERLNQEKITPHFMNLVRNDAKQSHNLNTICDDNGDGFESEVLLENYVTNFYSELYKKPNNEPVLTDDSVSRFLSDSGLHPAVLDSKLNNDEKNTLDADLDILEFDTAATQIKLNSSPGIDGISNRFIKKFWTYFRVPIFKYADFCLSTGRLTENFRTAKIRLIPKKTDPKKISNWRPISLLSCFYKIISWVLTNRLK